MRPFRYTPSPLRLLATPLVLMGLLVALDAPRVFAAEAPKGVEGEGAVDGEGSIEGFAEGIAEGEGVVEGTVEGVVEGEGATEGAIEAEGVLEGEGVVEGVIEGEGTVEGEGAVEGGGEGVVEGEGSTEGVSEGEGISEGEGLSEGEGVTEGEGSVEGDLDPLTDVIYVRKENLTDGEGEVARDGLTWDSAFFTIQEGVDAALALGRPEVWVARGRYDVETNENGALQLAAGVAVYGGFERGATARSERDPTRFVTTIDGSTAAAGDAAEHVAVGADGAHIEGFTISGGVGDGGGLLANGVTMTVSNCIFRDNAATRFGGGVLAVGGADITLLGCVFRENSADINGAGVSASNATVRMTYNLFYRNTTGGKGGGAYFGTGAAVYMVGCRFTENEAAEGGGMAVAGSGVLSARGCWFGRNRASLLGGGAQIVNTPDATISNCVFSLNQSDVHGGAVDSQECSPFFLANTFSGNGAFARGAVLYNQGQSQPRVRNCIFANSTGVLIDNLDVSPGPVEYSLTEGTITPGVGNLAGDPRFVSEANEQYGLKPGSPAIDTGGEAASLPNGNEPGDHVGNARGFDGDGFGAISGDGSEYDMGAFEAPFDGSAGDSREVSRLEHSGDTNADFIFDLSEVLRVIQLYNAGSFGCNDGTEDGFDPTGEVVTCDPHSADYEDGDFSLSLSELLRTIQLFNLTGYYLCSGNSEDDFCGV